MNDLWKYSVADGTWTWMSGNSTKNQLGHYGTKGEADELNVPSSRRYAVGWYDSSREEFWMFGGYRKFILDPEGVWSVNDFGYFFSTQS